MTEILTRVQVLAVSPSECDLLSLSQILGHSAWQIETAGSIAAALRFLRQDPAQVVVCDRALPDGDWKDLLASLSGLTDPPELIVTSRDADESLWAEVLNVGAYDVLVKPFNPKEVFRTVGLAWRHWMTAHQARTAAIPKRTTAIEALKMPLAAAAS